MARSLDFRTDETWPPSRDVDQIVRADELGTINPSSIWARAALPQTKRKPFTRTTLATQGYKTPDVVSGCFVYYNHQTHLIGMERADEQTRTSD